MNYRDDIKAIMFDFDGTLIDFNYRASDYTRIALEELKDKGYKLCLASGRPCFLALKAFIDIFGEYPLDYIFGCNCTEMMDVRKNEITMINPLSIDDVRYLGIVISQDYLVLGIYEETQFLINRTTDNEEIRKWLGARWLNPVEYDYSKNDKVRSKVIVLNDPADRDREIEYISTLDLSRFNAAYSSPYCLEIVPRDVSKAYACDILSKILGIDNSQILAFGDESNDIDMLKNCTGVIMGNARQEFLDMIPLHTASVDSEGIYAFLKENHLI